MTEVTKQVKTVNRRYGERHDMVVLDNNILAINGVEERIAEIRGLGFEHGAKRTGRERCVDFNQGLDARIICEKPELARHLRSLCLRPVRLAFDFNTPKMENNYRRAVTLLSEQGFDEFTNYMLFNFDDSPMDLYYRLFVNADLNEKLGIRITGFPMRFTPMDEVKRGHVSAAWQWRYLRGIQCILLATRGLVSSNPDFIRAAFGATYEEFLEIISMPDDYIIYRRAHENNGASEWRKKYRSLTESRRKEFLDLLAKLNKDKNRVRTIANLKNFRDLVEHYYPKSDTPPQDNLADRSHDQSIWDENFTEKEPRPSC